MAIEESNMGFWDYEETLGSALPGFNRQALSFQSGVINHRRAAITSEAANNYTLGSSCFAAGLDSGTMIARGRGSLFTANSSGTRTNNNNSLLEGITQDAGGNAFSGSLLVDTLPTEVKHEDASSAVEWSTDEQIKLGEGLFKYGNEPTIMRYVKIAATLRDKTVRDVALRCRWMTRKRRKQEDHNLTKKMKDWKEKLVESSSKTYMSSDLPLNMGAHSLTFDQLDHNQLFPFKALSASTRHLLEENNRILGQISANLSTYKFRDNLDLLSRARNNLTAILNDMREMPGIMSQMPPLPVSVDEELANSLSRGTQCW